jgi:hypothetical protein
MFGEGRREKGEGRREKGEGRREKGEGILIAMKVSACPALKYRADKTKLLRG